jgi:hypothetical protein
MTIETTPSAKVFDLADYIMKTFGDDWIFDETNPESHNNIKKLTSVLHEAIDG